MSPRRSATCPGLVLLESARPGRNARWTYLTADPVAVLESPAAGPDPFAVARRLVARLDRTVVVPADAPPFLGGLVGFLGYDLGRDPRAAARDRAGRPGPAAAPSRAPRLGRRLGSADRPRLARRPRARWRRASAGAPAGRRPCPARRTRPAGPPSRRRGSARSSSARASTARPTRPASSAIREHIADGDIYQANLTRRLEAAVRRRAVGPLPPPADRRPVALLGLSRSRARPAERPAAGAPLGLARAVPVGRRRGRRQDRPDQGHAPAWPRRGERSRARARAAVERQGPRRERDDRGRPAQRPRAGLPAGERPGPAAVPARADGRRPAPRLDRDRACWPRAATRSTCWRRRSRVARSPARRRSGRWRSSRVSSRSGAARTPGAIGWIGPDGAMQTSIVIRTFVADGQRLTLHVGGGITWKSDPAAEWDETVTKARGPLGAIGARGGRMSDRDGRDRRAHDGTRLGRRPPPAGRRPAPVGLRSRLPARRRHLRDAAGRAAAARPS